MTVDWRELWEEHAEADRAKIDSVPVEKLITDIKAGKYGEYYNIWYSIAGRADLQSAGWILFEVLNREIDYLYRYHCAAALLSLLQCNDFESAELSSENHNYVENLDKLSVLLEQKIGSSK